MRIVDSAVTAKIAFRAGAACYKLEDGLAGYTSHGRTYRADYKRATRHARRAMNLNVRRGLFAD